MDTETCGGHMRAPLNTMAQVDMEAEENVHNHKFTKDNSERSIMLSCAVLGSRGDIRFPFAIIPTTEDAYNSTLVWWIAKAVSNCHCTAPNQL